MPRVWMLVLAGCTACASQAAPAAAPEELTFEVLHVASDATPDLDARPRFDALAEQVARAPVDVLCVQGVGAPGDRARLKTALSKFFPTSIDLPTDDSSPVDDARDAMGAVPSVETKAPCSGVEPALDGVLACFEGNRTNCLTNDNVAYRSCLLPIGCLSDERFAPDPERRCRACIVGHARTGSTLSEISTRCRNVIHPLTTGGQHGMMILSKVPLSRPSLHVLPSEGSRRAIIGATLTTPRGATVDVFCATLGPTHDSALPSDPLVSEPYPGPYGAPRDGWVRENELQVEKLLTQVTARREGRPAVVLGNFGASPQIERNGVVVVPASGRLAAERLEQAFAPGIAATYAPSCTICSENTLARQIAPSFDNRIYLAGLDQDSVVASTRSHLGAVVRSEARTGRVPLTMQFGFRSRIIVGPSR